MNSYKSLWLISLLSFMPLISNHKTHHYTTPLSLHLIKDGISSFITEAKDKSEKDLSAAIQGMITCAPKNQTNAKETLQELHDSLKHKIERIEFQLQHKRLLNRKDLALGTTWIAAGIGLSALEYYAYSKWLAPSLNEKSQIEKSIEQQNGKITIDTFKKISVGPKPGTKCTQDQQAAFNEQSERLAQLYNDNENLGPALMFSACVPASAFVLGICKIISSFRPNADNHNLEHYKKVLEIVERFQKETK